MATNIAVFKTTTANQIQIMFTTSGTAQGGRNGHTESADGLIKADLSVPKTMGGAGKAGTTTPEDLFAAGYAACFAGAVDLVGKMHQFDATNVKVTCSVSIGARKGSGYGLSVNLRVEEPNIPQDQLMAFVHEAHEKICPYSHATRNNIQIEFEIVGA